MRAVRSQDEQVITQAELLQLLRVSDGAILIGGQALAFWVGYFRIAVAEGLRRFISGDADFLGFRWHVEAFSLALGGRAAYPSKRAITALYGVVMKQTIAGERMGVDVLHAVVGIAAEDVRKRALDVHHPNDASARFKVMEPIDCMVSRFENLRTLADKQNEVGVWQARISVAVCRAHLKNLITLGDERQAIRAANRIFAVAGAAAGLQAFGKHDIDLLDGIPIEDFATETFRDKQHTHMVARIAMLRNAFQPPPDPTARASGRQPVRHQKGHPR